MFKRLVRGVRGGKGERERGGVGSGRQDEAGSSSRPASAAGSSLSASADGSSLPASAVTGDRQSVEAVRKRLKIKVTSGAESEVPHAPWTAFVDQCLGPQVCSALADVGYDRPTPVQAQTIPLLLDGRDCMVCAPTGTGKTLAYMLPLLMHIKRVLISSRPASLEACLAVVILPTQELAHQVFQVAEKLIKRAFEDIVIGLGDDTMPRKVHCLISTPMKTVFALKGGLKLDSVQMVVLDEADLLLDLGLLTQTDKIIASCLHRSDTTRPQIAMLTATLPSGVESLASTVLDRPVRVIVGHKGVAVPLIEQRLQFVADEDGKLSTLRTMMREGLECPTLIFVDSIERANQLHKMIKSSSYRVGVIHASLDRTARLETCLQFRQGKLAILITTDLFARGLDFPGLANVINYDFPKTTSAYLHRIGRTGRAGEKGRSTTFFTLDDGRMLKSVVNVMQASGSEIPEWMRDLPKVGRNERRLLRKTTIKREKIGRPRAKVSLEGGAPRKARPKGKEDT